MISCSLRIKINSIFVWNSLIPLEKLNITMDYKFIKTDYLESVTGGDPEIILEIVALFKEQSVEIFNEMTSLYSVNNFNALGLLAHKAKSSVSIMGIESLSKMLKEFEIQARNGDESHLYPSYIKRFREETDAAVLELEDYIKNGLNNR
jgi:HPt (histidine-containing phosphotransfer) domain-containing protein